MTAARRALLIALACLSLALGPAPAVDTRRPDGWRIIGPGGGGATMLPTISPHDPRVVLVACDMTGAYVTENGGDSWRMFNLGTAVSSFAFDPTDRNVIYAGTAALWRSADRGRTWRMVFPDPARRTRALFLGDHADYALRSDDPLYAGAGPDTVVQGIAVAPDGVVTIAMSGGRPRGSQAPGALFQSASTGERWRKLRDLPPGRVLALAAAQADDLLVVLDTRVLRHVGGADADAWTRTRRPARLTAARRQRRIAEDSDQRTHAGDHLRAERVHVERRPVGERPVHLARRRRHLDAGGGWAERGHHRCRRRRCAGVPRRHGVAERSNRRLRRRGRPAARCRARPAIQRHRQDDGWWPHLATRASREQPAVAANGRVVARGARDLARPRRLVRRALRHRGLAHPPRHRLRYRPLSHLSDAGWRRPFRAGPFARCGIEAVDDARTRRDDGLRRARRSVRPAAAVHQLHRHRPLPQRGRRALVDDLERGHPAAVAQHGLLDGVRSRRARAGLGRAQRHARSAPAEDVSQERSGELPRWCRHLTRWRSFVDASERPAGGRGDASPARSATVPPALGRSTRPCSATVSTRPPTAARPGR